MFLLSCPRCARQYDVTHLEPKSAVRCVCDERFEVTWSRPFVVARLQCANCAGPVERDDEVCRYCGSALPERERARNTLCPSCFARIHEESRHCNACGVEIRPQALAPIPDGRRCPRCDGELRIRALDAVSVVECSACEGLWIEAAAFATLCERSRRQGTACGAGARMARSAPNTTSDLRYVPCLACGELMFRRQFWSAGRASGVVIDRCKDHGVWLDERELESVIAFLRSIALLPEPATRPAIPGLEEALSPSKRSAARVGAPATGSSAVDAAISFVGELLFGELFG